jgi:hypothetical protein
VPTVTDCIAPSDTSGASPRQVTRRPDERAGRVGPDGLDFAVGPGSATTLARHGP